MFFEIYTHFKCLGCPGISFSVQYYVPKMYPIGVYTLKLRLLHAALSAPKSPKFFPALNSPLALIVYLKRGGGWNCTFAFPLSEVPSPQLDTASSEESRWGAHQGRRALHREGAAWLRSPLHPHRQGPGPGPFAFPSLRFFNIRAL